MQTTVTPIINNQPVKGSNKTSKIPSPNPIKHTANVFFNKCFITLFPPLVFVYYINFLLYLFLFMYNLTAINFFCKILIEVN